MSFRCQVLGDFISLEKGLTYKGEFLSATSEVGLIGMDSFKPGGGYKRGSEKPYEGPFKNRNTASAGDLILCCTDVTQDGSVLAAPLLVPEDLGGYSTLVFSHHVGKVIEIREGLRPEFIYNFLRIPINRIRCAYGDTGTTVRALPYEVICEQQIPVPTMEEQDRINSFIAVLDRKIELNNSIAVNLERIAQSVFRSWFIDFDPVKAKMAGEKPVGMDDATAALFPDRMEDSELSPIPKGWELCQIGDEVECVGGSTPSTTNTEFWDGDICWTTPKDLSKQIGLITTTSERRITSKGLEKISSGVLPVNSVLMSSRAPIGYLSINAVPSAINQGFIALRQNSKFAPLYLLFWLQTNMAEIKNRAGGGTFAEISKTAFKSIPFVVPDEGILKKYEEISEPTLLQLAALTLQNQELIELRDSLLPRLITGELQIPEKMLVS